MIRGAREESTELRRKSSGTDREEEEGETEVKRRRDSIGGWKGRRQVMNWMDRETGRGGVSG